MFHISNRIFTVFVAKTIIPTFIGRNVKFVLFKCIPFFCSKTISAS